MTTNEEFENWFIKEFGDAHYPTEGMKLAWQAAAELQSAEVAQLKEENALMREALTKIALGYVYDADIISSAGDCLQRISAAPSDK